MLDNELAKKLQQLFCNKKKMVLSTMMKDK